LIAACSGASRYAPERVSGTGPGEIINIRPVKSIGPFIADKINLVEPYDITVNQLGVVYVTDRELNTIIRLSGNLESLSYEGGVGGDLGDFNRLSGIDCDAAMNIYAADPGNRRVQILDRSLHQATAINEYFEKDGSARRFNRPEDVAIDFEGNIWVADDDRILKINPFNELELELSYSSLIRLDIGKAISIAASGSGVLAIGDSGNRKIFIVSAYGNLISEFPVVSISSVAWEGKDIIWVSSRTTGTISVYDIYGNRRFIFGDQNSGSKPASIAIDNQGRLLIADSGLKKISLYEIIRDSANKANKSVR
jgi:sugar lactone lactonase YvrE